MLSLALAYLGSLVTTGFSMALFAKVRVREKGDPETSEPGLTWAHRWLESIPGGGLSSASGVCEEWKLVTSGTKSKAAAPPKGLQLRSRLAALKAEGKPDVLSGRASGPADPELCSNYSFSIQFWGDYIKVEAAKIKSENIVGSSILCCPEAESSVEADPFCTKQGTNWSISTKRIQGSLESVWVFLFFWPWITF